MPSVILLLQDHPNREHQSRDDADKYPWAAQPPKKGEPADWAESHCCPFRAARSDELGLPDVLSRVF
jgi:hypothetical protein